MSQKRKETILVVQRSLLFSDVLMIIHNYKKVFSKIIKKLIKRHLEMR